METKIKYGKKFNGKICYKIENINSIHYKKCLYNKK